MLKMGEKYLTMIWMKKRLQLTTKTVSHMNEMLTIGSKPNFSVKVLMNLNKII